MSQSPSSAGAMGIGNVLNIKAEPGAPPQDAQQQQQGVTPDQQLQQQQLQQHHLQQQQQQQQQLQQQLEQQDLQQQRSLPILQLQTDRQGSPHGSEHSRYSGTMNASYPSPSAMAASPLPPMPNATMAPGSMVPQEMQQSLIPGVVHPAYQPAPEKAAGSPAAKPYPCAACGKPFARRSDLARHERIHSGVRPHRCDFPGCGKQFIQRSALTVHSRVHTGEKPHRCEQCNQPFSDSSSLARHRRIHLGTRPYKCPYVNCQKTFTRRTTLTRHQNHHTGTVEEAARARAEALAQGASAVVSATTQNKSRSASEQAAARDSPVNTPSPGHRPMSISPPIDLSGMGNMQYMGNSIPVHLRGDVHVASPSPTASSGYANGMRPTSHPAGYAPPQTLEPSIEPAQGPGSSIGSPHIGSVGWASPGAVGSPAQSPSGNGYVYPDPEGYPSGTPIAQMFYNSAAAMRRGSPEPVNPAFDPKGRQGEIWADAQ